MKRIEKLTAEHLSIYLAYGLEVIGKKHSEIWSLEQLSINDTCKLGGSSYYSDIYDFKPILRTRQSITPEELETFSICFRMWYDKPDFDYNLMVFSDIVKMAKLHIDTFGLIESGLAVYKETIKK